MIDDAMGFVDVMKSTIPKPPHGRVIFFPGDVIVSFIEQFHRAVKAAGTVHSCVDWGMIVQAASHWKLLFSEWGHGDPGPSMVAERVLAMIV